MQSFSDPAIPADAPQWFKDYARTLHNNIKKAAATASDSLPVRYLTSAPSKPQDGSIYMADGSVWNPGSGKGAYRASVSGSTVTYSYLG